MATRRPIQESVAVARWDRRFEVWFSPFVSNMIPTSTPQPLRESIRALSSHRRVTIRSLRRAERAFLVILGAPELPDCFPHAFDLACSYRYIRSLRDVVRGLLAVGEFDHAFMLLDRIILVLLEDSFVLFSRMTKVASLRGAVDAFAHNVRIFESAFYDLKKSKDAVCANI